MTLQEVLISLEAKSSQTTTQLEKSKSLISILKEQIEEVQWGHKLNRSNIAIHVA